LAANYQEVLLLTGTAVGKSSSAVERIEKVLDRSTNRQARRNYRNRLGYQERFGDAGLCSEGLRVLSDSFDGRKSSHREGTSGKKNKRSTRSGLPVRNVAGLPRERLTKCLFGRFVKVHAVAFREPRPTERKEDD
jgi:hypothetical protein